MKRLSVLLFSLVFLFSGCGTAYSVEWPQVTVLGAENAREEYEMYYPENLGAQAEVSPRSEKQPSPPPVKYNLLYETETPLGMYEPPDGCYLAAQTPPDEMNGPRAFNRATGKNHAVFAREMYLGEAFPEEWMLRCIAEQAAPLVILKPSGSGAYFSAATVTELAKRFGAYNIPMFAAFFPVEEDSGYDPTSYTLYFRYARAIFQEHAPKAAFVFAADAGVGAEAAEVYYPGDEAVDWVGINVAERYISGQYDEKILAQAGDIYLKYQQAKPVMLLTLGVSHFSTGDYVYRVREAQAELERVYGHVLQNWSRVKLIAYKEISEIQDEVAGGGKPLVNESFEDYTVTEEKDLLAAYREIIRHRRFVSELQASTQTPLATSRALLLSEYPALFSDGEMLIDTRVFGEMDVRQAAGSVRIGNVSYAGEDAFGVEGSEIYTTIDHEKKLVVVYKRIQ
ncbi:MAG: hypothetical protein LBR83_01625 [Clostridiales bacterium]|jgi:hypothetical protein|nr:hypothetical protein [Clostridiales bacterium]